MPVILHTVRRLCVLVFLAFAMLPAHAQFVTESQLKPEQLAIVINDAEPNSVKIGAYYRERRGIPASNVVHVTIPDKPRELAIADSEDREFWQGVRASPARSARDIRGRFKDIDRRLADIESYVTTENRSLAREIDQLR